MATHADKKKYNRKNNRYDDCCFGVSHKLTANGTGIYAGVAFPVPSDLVKDKKLN